VRMGCCSSSLFKTGQKEAVTLELKMRNQLEAEEVACVRTKQLSGLITEFEMLVSPDEQSPAQKDAYRAMEAYLESMDHIAEDRLRKLELTVTEVAIRLKRIEEISGICDALQKDNTRSEEDKRHARLRWDALRTELMRDMLSIVVHRDMWHHSYALAQLSDSFAVAKTIDTRSLLN